MEAHRDWTIYETLFLIEYAGAVPLGMLAIDLRRDPRDVAREAARLGLSTAYAGTPLLWCDECARWRGALDRSGRCPVCRQRALNRENEARTAALLAALSAEARETYSNTEAERAPRKRDPKPKPPDTSQLPPRDAVAAETAYLAALGEWEYRAEHRHGKAVQKRKERIAAKVREEGDKNPNIALSGMSIQPREA